MKRNTMMEQWMLMTLTQAHLVVGNDPAQSFVQIARQLEELTEVDGGVWPDNPDGHAGAVRKVVAEAARVLGLGRIRHTNPRIWAALAGPSTHGVFSKGELEFLSSMLTERLSELVAGGQQVPPMLARLAPYLEELSNKTYPAAIPV